MQQQPIHVHMLSRVSLMASTLVVADILPIPTSTQPPLRPLKHPSPLCRGAPGLGTMGGFIPHITFALASRMLPFYTAPIANPHPFLSTLLRGELLWRTNECTANCS